MTKHQFRWMFVEHGQRRLDPHWHQTPESAGKCARRELRYTVDGTAHLTVELCDNAGFITTSELDRFADTVGAER